MQIDHLIYAHPDLDTAVEDVANRFGVVASGGGQHPGHGTHNRLLALGARTYLEIIAPDPSQPEPDEPRPFGVQGISRGGLVGWALATDDIDAALTQARSGGYDLGGVLDFHREGVDGTLLTWRLTRNALTAGLVPFLIAWGDTLHPAASAPRGLSLRSLHIEHPEPASLLPSLAAVGADIDVRPGSAPTLVARIDGPNGVQELR